jgi:twinkle protein
MKNPPKDANDALRQSHQVGSLKSPSSSESTDLELIPNMISSAKALNHQRLESFKSLRGEILSNIRQPENVLSGAAITSLPRLSQTIKGLRKGELVILTGPTGCGKTTLLSQISLDLARQGAPVLWGSFEIRNAMLIEKMLRQFGGMNIKTMDHEKLERLADDFETLPLKFMNFHAGSDMSQVLEAMDFAVYRDDVQHIIIDNLQFMMPRTAIPGITGSQNMNHSCKSLQPNSIFTLISIASANLFQLTLCQSDFPFIL